MDNTYCSIIPRSSTSKFDCTQEKNKATQFVLEVLDEDVKRERPIREITQLEHEMVQPRDLDTRFGFDRIAINSRIDERTKRLFNAQRRSDTLFL